MKILCKKTYESSGYHYVFDDAINDFVQEYRKFIEGKWYEITFTGDDFEIVGENFFKINTNMRGGSKQLKDFYNEFFYITEEIRDKKLKELLS